MKSLRVLLLAAALPVAILVAAVAPHVTWRKATAPPAPAAAPDLPGTISFNRDVRPILVANCFRCHGADPGSREAELRLVECGMGVRREAGDDTVEELYSDRAAAPVERLQGGDIARVPRRLRRPLSGLGGCGGRCKRQEKGRECVSHRGPEGQNLR